MDYRSEPLVNPSNNEHDPNDNDHHIYGEDENDANKEFKWLLWKKIKANDPIWKSDSFDIEKFLEEPYLNIIEEISGKHPLLMTFLI